MSVKSRLGHDIFSLQCLLGKKRTWSRKLNAIYEGGKGKSTPKNKAKLSGEGIIKKQLKGEQLKKKNASLSQFLSFE